MLKGWDVECGEEAWQGSCCRVGARAPWIPQNQCGGCKAGTDQLCAAHMLPVVSVRPHPSGTQLLASVLTLPRHPGRQVACDSSSRLSLNRGDDFQEEAAAALDGFCYVI